MPQDRADKERSWERESPALLARFCLGVRKFLGISAFTARKGSNIGQVFERERESERERERELVLGVFGSASCELMVCVCVLFSLFSCFCLLLFCRILSLISSLFSGSCYSTLSIARNKGFLFCSVDCRWEVLSLSPPPPPPTLV